MKNLKVLTIFAISLLFTSCELLVDYSGTYSGTVDATLTVNGITTTDQSPLSNVIVAKEDGVYYFDGVPLDGAGSTFSYVEPDLTGTGLDYIVNLEFTTTDLSLSYEYEIDLGGGVIYYYVISGTLDKQ